VRRAWPVPPNLMLVPSSPQTNAPSTVFSIDTPVAHPQWREEVAGTIASVVTRGIERAELRVTPPELGPVEVRIDVSRGEATLTIVAAQPATRDALEQALPLLRDLLADSGLALGDTSVRQGHREQDAPRSDARDDRRDDEAAAIAATPLRITLGPPRLVDVFA
jgi:flagellar hook-length control protein FliK